MHLTLIEKRVGKGLLFKAAKWAAILLTITFLLCLSNWKKYKYNHLF